LAATCTSCVARLLPTLWHSWCFIAHCAMADATSKSQRILPSCHCSVTKFCNVLTHCHTLGFQLLRKLSQLASIVSSLSRVLGVLLLSFGIAQECIECWALNAGSIGSAIFSAKWCCLLRHVPMAIPLHLPAIGIELSGQVRSLNHCKCAAGQPFEQLSV
jgi:hypothetical protein